MAKIGDPLKLVRICKKCNKATHFGNLKCPNGHLLTNPFAIPTTKWVCPICSTRNFMENRNCQNGCLKVGTKTFLGGDLIIKEIHDNTGLGNDDDNDLGNDF
jgi:hypothetical protein